MFFEFDGSAPASIAAVEDYPSLRIVRLRGPIDSSTVADLEKFRKWVAGHKGFKPKHILLDFKLVTRMDTSAVAQIIQTVGELRQKNFRLGAFHLVDEFSSLLQVLKVDKWITFYDNESEALRDLTGKK